MRNHGWTITAVLAILTTGCSWQAMRPAVPRAPAPAQPAIAIAPAAPKAPEGPTPVEQALELQRKLDECTKLLAQAREHNEKLVTANADLTTRSGEATMELKQARQELDDANLMLREMKKELTKWKQDVLGFRQEMRQAQAAQLDALHRVLKVLGAETPKVADTTAAAPATPAGTLSSVMSVPAKNATVGN